MNRVRVWVRRAAVLVPGLLLAMPLAAGAAQGGQEQQAKQAFETFFAPNTPPSQRAQLLQNGKKFEKTLEQQSKLPAAKESKTIAKNVQVQGDKATVTYSIELNGQPALQDQKGELLKQGGKWKVSDDTFCHLEAMRGSPPAGCPASGK